MLRWANSRRARHELADDASDLRPADDHRPNKAVDQVLARVVVAVMTPTNHWNVHPWFAASVTTPPRFMGILGGVQQRPAGHDGRPCARSGIFAFAEPAPVGGPFE